MNMIKEPSNDSDAQDSAGLNRRAVLMTAAVAASAAAGISPALADTPPPASFGAPLVEVQVPAGVLTLEQKAAMIKGVTDVVSNAMKLTPGPTTRFFAQIIETVEGGFGVNGQVFVPRAK
jgi:phenylpyruvate tautomerase PptA (4-oxalocrotonate tautomerase family)